MKKLDTKRVNHTTLALMKFPHSKMILYPSLIAVHEP